MKTSENKIAVIEFMGMISEKFGAIERYNIELSAQLNFKGIKTVFVYNQFPQNETYIKSLQENNADILELPINKSFFHKIISVNKILKKYNPDIIHCHFCFPLIRIIIFLSWLKQIHKRFVSIRSMHGEKAGFISKIWWLGLAKLSTKFLAVSNPVREKLIDNFNIPESKIDVLKTGINFQNFENLETKEELKKKYGLPTNKKIIGCVAFHQPIKGVDVLLDALAILKNKYNRNDIILAQIGYYQGKYADKIKEQTISLNIHDIVFWLGLQNNVPELMKTFDVYCQPSRSEGLPQAVVEALASKLAVVATNVGGIPEIIKNNSTGFLVESEDAEKMAECINTLLNDAVLSEQFGTNGFNLVFSRLNSKVQVTKLIENYYGIH